ncbi:hypothetical protein DM860_004013 [Cuscuta australis]|uniref:Uncharacterized protein n=1 Tax=Cuscuta australis TaxID=267555 RepID=A0A328CXR7_9ASTE|nr:hypothetical protein DM860_004013 [Cuscuta australis]
MVEMEPKQKHSKESAQSQPPLHTLYPDKLIRAKGCLHAASQNHQNSKTRQHIYPLISYSSEESSLTRQPITSNQHAYNPKPTGIAAQQKKPYKSAVFILDQEVKISSFQDRDNRETAHLLVHTQRNIGQYLKMERNMNRGRDLWDLVGLEE